MDGIGRGAVIPNGEFTPGGRGGARGGGGLLEAGEERDAPLREAQLQLRHVRLLVRRMHHHQEGLGRAFGVGASRYPRVQVWSIADYFDGRIPQLPALADPYTGKAVQSRLG